MENECYIVDGDGTNGSTNGTWIFAERDYPLENGTVFKAGQSLFQAILE